jgi:ABC-2 type transport system permease protein
MTLPSRSDLSLLARWVVARVRLTLRNPRALMFTFAFPLILMTMLNALSGGERVTAMGGTGAKVDFAQFFTPSVAIFGLGSACYTGVVFGIASARDTGLLKRVRGTPLPTSAYLAGIAGNAITNTALQVGLITAAGSLVFGLDWPQGWAALVVFVVLGVVCFASLGVALSHAIPNFDSAPAYVNAAFLPVIFISGVFFDADDAPGFLRAIAEVLPLKHLIDGLSGAMVTGDGLGAHVPALLVLALWSAAGVVLAVRGFSWDARK